MAKRQLSDDELEYHDTSEPHPIRNNYKRPARKRTKTSHADNLDDCRDTHAAGNGANVQHSLSTHIIASPAPIQRALLDWYSGVHDSRGMPWRKRYDPTLGADERAQRAYEVWVSEIMLQQTQVVTVIPYYNKWMEKFPTINDLAASEIETVNALWKGLGYYSRAARLLAGAQKAVKEYNGRLPDNAKDMEAKIPGIGRYSAGAICSIAYNQCVPVLDGNVNRLLSRLLALHAPPKAKLTLDVLWSAATSMVEGTDLPGDLNQGLIELGSTVCKVRDPACSDCPLREWCKAYQKDVGPSSTNRAEIIDIEEICTLCAPFPKEAPVTAYPMKVERKRAREELDVVNVIEWRPKNREDRYFLLVRRPEGGLLAGLHEFPTSPNVSSSTPSDLRDIPHSLLSTLLVSPPQPYVAQEDKKRRLEVDATDDSLRITMVQPAGDVIHVFSHIRKTYRVQWVLLEGGTQPPDLCLDGGQKGKLIDGKRKRNTEAKKRRKKKGVEDEDDMSNDLTPVPLAAMWTLMDKVEDANIGTGVLKVWNQVRVLWEE